MLVPNYYTRKHYSKWNEGCFYFCKGFSCLLMDSVYLLNLALLDGKFNAFLRCYCSWNLCRLVHELSLVIAIEGSLS